MHVFWAQFLSLKISPAQFEDLRSLKDRKNYAEPVYITVDIIAIQLHS